MHEITNILQQIADNTATDNAVWVAAVSGGAAVLGATVSALVSYFITKRSIDAQDRIEDKKLRASIVTNERLRWLQDIRIRLSDLYVNLDMQYNFIQRPLGNLSPQQMQDLLDEYSSEVMSSVNMLSLMLNDKDKPQIDLRNELQSVLQFMQSCFSQFTSSTQTFNNQQYAQMKTKIFNLATEIGSETWEQISNLE
jgi:hypothetical protein